MQDFLSKWQVTSGSLFARNICDDTGKKMKGGLKEMAGVEWKGAKCKGGGQAKGVLRHTDKGERLKREHENPDIDRDKTEQNFS